MKALGRATGSTRTPEQTALAGLLTESAALYWNRTLRGIATAQGLALGDSARLFALVEMAMADAVITAWNSKNFYQLWRPITAIRLGDTDGNPNTAPDPAWTPFLITPNYPDYTSGANNATDSATRMLHLFFGTNQMDFDLMTSTGTRRYTHFSKAADDVVDVRVLQGIHFRFADTAARTQGRNIAKWAFKRFLRPVDDVESVEAEEEE